LVIFILAAASVHANSAGRRSGKDTYAKVVLIDSALLASGTTSRSRTEKLGVISFHERPDGTVRITGTINGLSRGKHGIHVHEFGDLSGGCDSAKEHFNPTNLTHGAPSSTTRHVGDLGNVRPGSDGVTHVDIQDSIVRLHGPHSIIGRTLVVHVGEDDLGLGNDEESLKSGNADGRVACGIVGYAPPDSA